MAKKPKSPFRHHSVEQVAYAEATSYVIQVGIDFFENKGHLVFSEKTAYSNYSKLLSALVQTIHEGDEEDRKVALKCLGTLKVLPLRIQ